MLKKFFYKVNWNECLYLYRTGGSKHIENLLNDLYFTILSKWIWKHLKSKEPLFDDLQLFGYESFKKIINTMDYKNKDFIRWTVSCLIYSYKNELRKQKTKNKAWDDLDFNSLNIISDIFYKSPSEIYENKENDKIKSQWFKKAIKEVNSALFEQIVSYKNQGYTHKEISKLLNKSLDQIRGCWNYYKQKIFELSIRDQIFK
ncbi:hypothetical protein D8X55_00480 [Malacoplasma penetrans]|uniref:hypothetical protein n=1 Tax=Malacoplasma penetrans TaxID=28227 RepID=UPI0010137842|nr:hypothetical protein [Malacoplasma penetrans]RXY97393.1 hypothetical protein D8X55_00480 [Malacoplasma penetrans]